MSFLYPDSALLVVPQSTIRQRVNVAKKCMNMEPDAGDLPMLVFMGFVDHLDMKRLLEPLLGPSYNETGVRKALEILIQEIEYAVSQFNTEFTRVIFVSSPGYKY